MGNLRSRPRSTPTLTGEIVGRYGTHYHATHDACNDNCVINKEPSEHKSWESAPNRRSNPIDWETFRRIGGSIARAVHSTAEEHGFHKVGNPPRRRSPIEATALIHEEVAEITRAFRSIVPKFSEHIPDFYESEEELADVIIRSFELAVNDMDIDRVILAMQAKVEYNKGRPFKHGKTI